MADALGRMHELANGAMACRLKAEQAGHLAQLHLDDDAGEEAHEKGAGEEVREEAEAHEARDEQQRSRE